MNWITRCPECSTVYQVAPDQLQVAKGWLRCGCCQHAFDSAGLLLAWSDEQALKVSDTKAHVTIAQHLDVQDFLKQEDGPVETTSSSTGDLASFEQALFSFKPAIEKAIAELSSAPQITRHSREADDSPQESARDVVQWRSGFSRLWALVLLLSLVGQSLWIGRHALLGQWPAMEAPVHAICDVMTCQSVYLQDVQGMVIDSSSFTDRHGVYELAWTVRNSALQTLAMTSLELTLQDMQGQPVVRRVLTPADVGAPKSLSPGQVWSGQLMVRMDSDVAVTGYRVLNFYP
ncbi:zinc-ribbon and DUF3426 domain-containing protein [Limnohabitans sp. Jir72]|uniref:zinc-ribbon and DUF3426 domain-containing protein n=1 Tax=Limnohabitans sp. Jir72 TaxID=1977909 RepID=UPI000D394C82|nr:zinc-ribbon and DUF3426 domain-containing protein [Limnohabitans sp. Jir72]PUE29957.1 hypothetical protein B9Z52_13665 [Limnohabitans sp. Jir72]